MTKEQEYQILVDLCGRLPYGNTEVMLETRCITQDGKVLEATKDVPQALSLDHIKFLQGNRPYSIDHWVSIKPILRPMSSMTMEEEILYSKTFEDFNGVSMPTIKTFEWLNKYNFDYRDLIKLELAYPDTHYL